MKKVFFLAGIILSCLLFGCSNEAEKKAIEDVLEQDRLQFDTVKAKANHMSSIDLTKCPLDFRQKYIAHIGAWREFALVEHEAEIWQEKHGSLKGGIAGAIRVIFGDLRALSEPFEEQNKLKEHYFTAKKKIKDTWNDVLQCAAKYGVDTSKYR